MFSAAVTFTMMRWLLVRRLQHVDHFEAFGALGVIDPGDFHQLLVFVLIAQEAQGVFDALAHDCQDDFAMGFRGGDEHGAERLGQRIDDADAGGEFGGGVNDAHRSIVPTRRILRCSCITP